MRLIKSFVLLLLGSALIVCFIYKSRAKEEYAIIFRPTSVVPSPKKENLAVMQASAAVGTHVQNVKVRAVPNGISEVESTVKTNALEAKSVSGQAILGIVETDISESSDELEKAVMQEPDTLLARSIGEAIVTVMNLINTLKDE